MKADVRKIVVVMDEVHREMGRAIQPPTRRAAAAAVIANPFAGTYVEDLSDLIVNRGKLPLNRTVDIAAKLMRVAEMA